MITVAEAMLNPAACFREPRQVLDQRWTDDDKYKVLRQWKYDLGQLQVATEENMPPPPGADDRGKQPPPATIKQIHAAMAAMGYPMNADPVPTKGA